MRELLPDLARWKRRGERVVLATVVATRRSAPRPVGSKLAVSEGGELAGSVSGGCVENEVYAHARELLAGGPPRLLTYGISDDQALEVGLPCGGELDVFVAEPEPDLLERLTAAVEANEEATSVTIVEGDPLAAQVLVTPDGSTAGDRALDGSARAGLREVDGRTVFFESYGPPARLVAIGAGDVAEALCRGARALGWRTVVADPRAKLVTPERVPSADELLVAWPEEALARIAPDRATAVVILTHEERFDVPALTSALASEAFYIGALGSRRTQARRRERLLEAGVDRSALGRVSGPCGLDVGAETPAEMAVSILAEILAVRAARAGGRLRSASERIHAGVA